MRLHTLAVALCMVIAISSQGGISADFITKFQLFKPNSSKSASRYNNVIKLAPLYNKFWNKLYTLFSKFVPKPIGSSPGGIRPTTPQAPIGPPGGVGGGGKPPIIIPGPLVPIPGIPGGSAGIGTGELEPFPELPGSGRPPGVITRPPFPIAVRPPGPQIPIPELPGAGKPPGTATAPQIPIDVEPPDNVGIVTAPQEPIDVEPPGGAESTGGGKPPKPQIPIAVTPPGPSENFTSVDESDSIVTSENEDPLVDYDAIVEARSHTF